MSQAFYILLYVVSNQDRAQIGLEKKATGTSLFTPISRRLWTNYTTHFQYCPQFFNSSLYCIFHYHLSPHILFHLYPHPPSPITTMSSFSLLLGPSTPPPSPPACFLSMSLSLFFFLRQFVPKIPHMNETIWYLSFCEWPISLSIMFSKTIHAVTKGK